MGRTPQIRITKNDRKEYARLVKNAKAKINRTIKEKGSQVVVESVGANGEKVYEKVDIRSMVQMPSIDQFTSRKDFNAIKQQLSNFTNRNNRRAMFRQNEYGVVTTQATLNAIEKNNKEAIRNAKKAQEKAMKLPFIQGREEQGTVGIMRMGKKNPTGINIPNPFDFSRVSSADLLIAKGKNTLKQADPTRYDKRAENAKKQIADSIERSFNGMADEIADKVRNLPTDIFNMMYQMFDEFSFEHWYVPEGFEEDYATQQEMRALSNINYYLDLYYEGRLEEKFPGVNLKDF